METIAAYAQNMSEFLNESELTERRAFIESFVKEIIVMPGDALMRYTFPMPDDSPIPGKLTERVALDGSGAAYNGRRWGLNCLPIRCWQREVEDRRQHWFILSDAQDIALCEPRCRTNSHLPPSSTSQTSTVLRDHECSWKLSLPVTAGSIHQRIRLPVRRGHSKEVHLLREWQPL